MFEIGTSLREARERHGADLVEAEQATKIRSKYLRALEEERFELLPAQTYVKGFLRSYAEYLGLDGQLYVDEYNSRYVTGEDEALTRPRRTSSSRAHRQVESSVLLLALAGIAAVTALVVVAWRWGGSEQEPIPGIAADGTRERPAAADRPRSRAAPAGGWIALQLTAARGDSKLTVYRGSATGKLLFDGTLEHGKRQQFTGRRLWLLASEPDNLAARINGRLVRLPGDGSAPIVALASARGIAPVPSA